MLLKHLYRMMPGYWRIKRLWQNIGLWLATVAFNLQLGYRDTSSSLSIIFVLTRTVLVGGSIVVALALGLVSIDFLLRTYGTGVSAPFNISVLSSPLETLLRFLKDSASNKTDFCTFFGTIAGAAATLLALYIGAIGVVASTSYSEVSSALRELLLRDKVSNAFVRLLLLTFGMSVILLLFSAGTFKPGFVSACVLALVVIFLIAIGGRIATRAFIFFEPSTLLDQLNEELAIWIPHVALPGRFAEVPSFQIQIRNRCERLLGVYEDLSTVCLKRYKGSNEAPSVVAENVLYLYVRYCRLKQTIPTKSKWFTFAKRHSSWFTADSARVSGAVAQQGYPMFPEDEADLHWVERRLTELLSKLVDPDFESNRLDNLSKPLALLGSAMLALGESLLQEEAMQLSQSMKRKYLNLIPSASGSADAEEPRLRLFVGSIECIAKAPSDLAAGINRFLSSLTADGFTRTTMNYLRLIGALRPASLPRTVLDTVFLFRENLDFERETEGRELTPNWFVVSRCGVALAGCIVESILPLIDYCESEALLLVRELRSKKQSVCAAQAIQGGILCCIKVEASVKEAEAALLRLKSIYRTPDWDWPQFNQGDCMLRLTSARKTLLREYAEICCEIMLMSKRDTSYPDYFGHGYCLVADACFEAIRARQLEEVEHLFRHLVAMGLSAGHWIPGQTNLTDPRITSLINYEIISDLIDLSGHAMTYSELDPNNFAWSIVKAQWEHILNTQPNSADIVKLLLAAAEDRLTGLEMSFRARAQSRSRWELYLQSDLQRLGLTQGILGFTFDESPFARRSESCVIDALLRSAGIAPNVGCLFGAQYLLKRKESTSALLSSLNLSETLHLQKFIERNIAEKEAQSRLFLTEKRLRSLNVRIRRIERNQRKRLPPSLKDRRNRLKLRRYRSLRARLIEELRDA